MRIKIGTHIEYETSPDGDKYYVFDLRLSPRSHAMGFLLVVDGTMAYVHNSTRVLSEPILTELLILVRMANNIPTNTLSSTAELNDKYEF